MTAMHTGQAEIPLHNAGPIFFIQNPVSETPEEYSYLFPDQEIENCVHPYVVLTWMEGGFLLYTYL